MTALLLALWTLLPSAPAQHPILVGAGDIAKCGSPLARAEQTARLLDQVVAEAQAEPSPTPVVVFTLGDAAYNRGRPAEFQRCFDPTWGRHRERIRPAPGNHEYGTVGAAGYFEYFGAAAGEPGRGYYAYDLGEWKVLVLNSVCRRVGGCLPGSPQHDWLAAELRDDPRRCTLAYFHHPLWSSGGHGQEKKMLPLYRLLYEGGVELVLSGHDHHYERFAPQTPDGALDLERGIRQFVVGTGGRGGRWYLRERPRPGPNSEVASGGVFGVLKLELLPEGYRWEFLSTDGGFTDSGERVCH